MKKIIYTKKFIKKFNNLDVKQQLNANKKIKLFKTGLYDKQLRVHKLTGKYKDEYAFSVEYDLRIVYTIENNTVKLYYLEHIGTHGQVYR